MVESAKIEKTTFPYKTALSEVNVKINRMGITRRTYDKEWSFASNYFIFSKILFQFKNFVVDLMYQPPKFKNFVVDLMYQPPKFIYSDFSKALEFYLRVLFPCEYL